MEKFTDYLSESKIIILISIIVIFNLTIHYPFLFLDTFGEQDAARLVLNGLFANLSLSNKFYPNPEPLYSAPLYNEILRIGFMKGLINTENSITWITYTSFIASALITVLLFLFVYKMTCSLPTAAGSCIVLQFNPTFWHNSIYGFPTIVSISLILLSLVLISSNLDRSKYNFLLVLTACFFFLIAVLIKVEIIFAATIFFI